MQIARKWSTGDLATRSPADAKEIDAGFEEVRGEGVAKTVDAAFGAMPAALLAA